MHDVLDIEEMRAAEEVQRREADAWPHDEPSELGAIEAAQPAQPDRPPLALDRLTLSARIHGAWLGRCAGCALGKPVEIWPRERIRQHLERAGAYPIGDYLPGARPEGMPRDDDIDFTILALHLLETYGRGFTTGDVAREWLHRFPFTQVYTAERAAYRNLVHGLQPPETATHLNPYREWIGAQIRADAFGYASPGDPRCASRLAYVDARLSHTGNGIYGAMWVAALIAASFAEPSMRGALASALAVVPERTRLADAVHGVLALHDRGLDWEAARDVIEERHGALSPVHTINNAAVVAAALLWGEGDFTRTVALAVQGGWDTDCNGATAGSAFGAMHGVEALPERWVAPLHDRVRSALFGFDGVRVSELADRTLRVALA